MLARYNLALAQAVLYDATEMRIRVWDHFGTVFSYVKLFGLMHRIYPIDAEGERVAETDRADGYEAVLDGPASLFSQTRKYGIRLANFLPALPQCDRWEMEAAIADDDAASRTRTLALDHTDSLSSHYSSGDEFDSDVERTLADKWERANTEWELVREDDVLDLGEEVMLPDFAVEHPDGRRALLEIVGFWTPEYPDEKLSKIRDADVDNLVVAVSERLDCAEEDFGDTADRVLWFKSGIHVYDVVCGVGRRVCRACNRQVRQILRRHKKTSSSGVAQRRCPPHRGRRPEDSSALRAIKHLIYCLSSESQTRVNYT